MGKFRGVAHVHSTYSFDGRLTLDELAVSFKARGIQFVLMSEHVESLDPEKLGSFISDCKQNSDESLLLIPGIEIDDLNGLFTTRNQCARGRIVRTWPDNLPRVARWWSFPTQ